MPNNQNNENQKKYSSITFIAGIIMLAAGLFWLTQIVQVSSHWGSWRWGNIPVSGGMVIVPLIAGVVWLFYNPKSVFAKILTGLGGVIIVASIIMSVQFYIRNTNFFVFILIFVFIAGGGGLVLRTIFQKK